MAKTLPGIIKANKIEKLFVLGDLTEEKDRHSATLVNRVVDHFWSLSKRCEIAILRGNHDGLDPLNPFFAFLRHFEGISWINNPTAVGRWMFLPHTSNYTQDWRGINFKDYATIFAHNTFQGAKGEHGHRLDGIPLHVFNSEARVYAGDVHRPQTLVSQPVKNRITKVTYVGAPYPIDFGDDYEPRIIMMRDGKTTSVKIPHQRRIMADIVRVKDLNEFIVDPGDMIKVRMTIHPDRYARVVEFEERCRKWCGKREITLCGFTTKTPGGITSYQSPNFARANLSDEEVLHDYAKRRKVGNATLKRGLNLMEKSK